VAVAAGVLLTRKAAETPLAKLVKPDLPMLELRVKTRDLDGDDLTAEESRIADGREAPVATEHCPALVGGDDASATTASSSTPRPADCPRVATWYVKTHPIALSLYFEQGKELLAWYDGHPEARELARSRFVQGLFQGLWNSLKVKAEDLKLEGLQGEFMNTLVREAIAAHGQLHYDLVHGREGWVLSFRRGDSAYAVKALPVMASLLASSGYKLAKLPAPVLEMRVGLQRFFLTEYQDRVYLAHGLEALLNVIESLTPPAGGIPDAPASLTLRAEVFVDKILPVMAGTDSLDLTVRFALKDGELGSLSLPAGPWTRHLHARIFEGVLAAIPHDSFAAVATSLRLPATWTEQDWRKLATDGPAPQAESAPEESGFAVVWDFDGQDSPAGAVGVIVANQTEPQATGAYQQYLRKTDLSAECGGGALFLAATSERLLNRMKESCARQSLSPLDWERGAAKQRYSSAQLAAFVNPGTGLKELFLAGGAAGDEDAGDFAPRWKQDYEKAKAAMRKDGDTLFGRLPILAYAGRAGGGQTVTLEGFAVSQGGGK
jgi:hypothetical protein